MVIRGRCLMASSAPLKAGPSSCTEELSRLRTNRHTYVRNEGGEWLLFDNINDPFQMNNLIQDNSKRNQIRFRPLLRTKMKNDDFESSDQIMQNISSNNVARPAWGQNLLTHGQRTTKPDQSKRPSN